MEVKRVLVDFRVNLAVSADDYGEAVLAGANFDEVNGVFFMPPRVDLLPVSEWLPFSLDGRMHNVLKVTDDTENIRVAKMLKPATPGGLGGSGPRTNSSRRHPSLSPEPPVPESVFIATQMRAIAAPFATKLACVFGSWLCS